VIEIRHTDADTLIGSLEPGSVAGVIADPPWAYRNNQEGGVADLYSCPSNDQIAAALDRTFDICGPSAYLAAWCTWPKLAEWFAVHGSMRWRYVTGGAWCKSNGFGMGYHAAGDSEFWLLYVKGSPRPADGRQTNAITAARLGHSEKPQAALEALVRTVAPAGGLILDPYAGESASLARACRRLGRAYVGAELDADRHGRAIRRLAGESATQARMRGQGCLWTL
jgi:DNA modification methylase